MGVLSPRARPGSPPRGAPPPGSGPGLADEERCTRTQRRDTPTQGVSGGDLQ
ncbi:hypothetical protein HMPREF0970_00074 [Schaalia odontolytica F0309]|uniref:Uncharacterized protein n=1 Tax=Schaalia odontolytica F0309 TaxID=649742 RepID=D4TVT4_9ACTO|nr:hypothetical protein HMPREF0970_00074 [Schaalia odontolytica F0309]